MITNKIEMIPMIPMTQQWLSAQLGMPNCGLAFGSPTLPSVSAGTPAFAATARERRIVATAVNTKGHMAVAKRDLAYLPGNNAWSPPPC